MLGALLEKKLATPDAYPLTLNALLAACNQTSNRDPVVQFEPQAVETAVLALKAKGLARVVHPGAGERATRYRQVLDEVLGLTAADEALLCVLLLRGAQTVAELRSRTERLHGFASAAEVESSLSALGERDPPLVAQVERRAGQKEGRWIQLLEVGAEERASVSPAEPGAAPGGRSTSRLDELEARVVVLEDRLARLLDALGDEDGQVAGAT